MYNVICNVNDDTMRDGTRETLDRKFQTIDAATMMARRCTDEYMAYGQVVTNVDTFDDMGMTQWVFDNGETVSIIYTED